MGDVVTHSLRQSVFRVTAGLQGLLKITLRWQREREAGTTTYWEINLLERIEVIGELNYVTYGARHTRK